VQCKQKDGALHRHVTPAALDAEVHEALTFKPKLKSFILATTGPTDGNLQERARVLTEQHKRRHLFTVDVWSWDDIWPELRKREKVLKQAMSLYWPRTLALVRDICFPSADLIRVADTSRLRALSGAHIVPASIWTNLPQTAWPRFREIDANYPELHKQLVLSLIEEDYDKAQDQYWNLLYYTGTRELWVDRAYLSRRLLDLSNKNGDYRTSGLILAKGDAWPLIYRRDFRGAKRMLTKARNAFVRARARSELGVFDEYMGDIYSETGNVRLADKIYLEARHKAREDDAHEIELKRLFMHAKHDSLGSRHRISELIRLRADFGERKSYWEGMVQIELAKSYHFLKAPEALITAEEAYSLLKHDVMMPTSAAEARRVVQLIATGKTITEPPRKRR
jgi:tetratricopeptide (TPR) repeat protein